jgi:Tol biopolymer transport system component
MEGSRWRRLLGAAAAVVAALAFTASGSGENRASPGGSGLIAFASIRSDGGSELYTMNDRGGRLVRLTAHSPPLSGPRLAWSPDGAAIGYVGGRDNSVLLADIRTGHVRSLPTPIKDVFPLAPGIAWAPDGRRIVFSVLNKHYDTDLWIANKDGSGRRLLTSGPDNDGAPAWSPDGAWIAFQHGGDDQVGRIEIIRSDGQGLREVGSGENPAWSPDGTHLVVEDAPDVNAPYPHHLFTVAVDGSSRRQLTSDVGSSCDNSVPGEYEPTWAPAARIAFLSCAGIEAIDPDGTGRRTLIGGAVSSPVWSPDGTRIAFVLAGNLERATVASANAATVAIANADGSSPRALLNPPPGDDSAPAWSPDGRRLAANLTPGTPTHVAGGVTLVPSPFWQRASWSPNGRRFVGNTGEGAQDVYIMNVDESGSQNLIYEDQGIGYLTYFASDWSPDGRRIALTAPGQGVPIAFYNVVRRKMTESKSPDNADHASWSPDGKRLAFDIGRGRAAAIFVARSDGSHAKRIARNASEPAWSPDGRKLAFVRILGRANSEIYVMNTDGTHQRRLTCNPGPDVEPDWSRRSASSQSFPSVRPLTHSNHG